MVSDDMDPEIKQGLVDATIKLRRVNDAAEEWLRSLQKASDIQDLAMLRMRRALEE